MKTELKEVIHLYIGSPVATAEERYNSPGLYLIGISDLGCQVRDEGIKLSYYVNPQDLKLRLRRLSSMTEEEAWEFSGGKSTLYDDVRISKLDKTGIEISYVIDAGEEGRYPQSHKIDFYVFTPKSFRWLLSKSFDLFGLLDSNQAIEQTPEK